MNIEPIDAPFKLGQRVRVLENCKYFHDWKDAEIYVAAMELGPILQVLVTVTEGVPEIGRRNLTDGFDADELEVWSE